MQALSMRCIFSAFNFITRLTPPPRLITGAFYCSSRMASNDKPREAAGR